MITKISGMRSLTLYCTEVDYVAPPGFLLMGGPSFNGKLKIQECKNAASCNDLNIVLPEIKAITFKGKNVSIETKERTIVKGTLKLPLVDNKELVLRFNGLTSNGKEEYIHMSNINRIEIY